MNLNPDERLTAEALLQHAAGLRALGRRMLDGASAEDLVQEAYLAALRSRPPSGGVGAWLHGIANKIVSLMRRQAIRRQRREQDGVRTDHAPSAADVVASAEVMRRIADAVRNLPAIYRTAVVLRFWHDLPPRKIALHLQVSVHTVRSRLQRALDLLRSQLEERDGNRAVWIASLECLLRPDTTFAAATGGMTLSTLGAIMTAGKLNVWLAAVALVAVALGVAHWSQASSEALSERLNSAAAMAVDMSERAVPDRHERSQPVANATRITGRCIAEENELPLAGCRVFVLAKPSPGIPTPEPMIANSGADGQFELSPDLDLGREYGLLVLSADRILAERLFYKPPTEVLEFGDIALQLGAMVQGAVRTADGHPVADVWIDCVLTSASGQKSSSPFAMQRALHSRSDGVVEGDGCGFGIGRWELALRSSDHHLVSPLTFDVEPGQRIVDLDVTVMALAELPAIRGVLVDEAGIPVGGIALHAGDAGNRATSATDGTFVIHQRKSAIGLVRLALEATAVCSLRDPETLYTWGSDRHRVVVRRPGGLALQVVEANTGTAIARYRVRVQSLVPEISRRIWGAGAEHTNGLLQLHDIRPGRYHIVAMPEDPGLAPSEPITVDLGSSGAMLQLACEPLSQTTVVLQYSSGEPVAGGLVDLVRREGDGNLTDQSLVGSEEYAAQFGVENRFIVLSSGRTDARGETVLQGPLRGYLGLRARGPFVSKLMAPVVAGLDRRIVMQVDRGATLQGSLEPASVLSTLKSVALPHWIDDNLHLHAANKAGPTLQLRSAQSQATHMVLPKRMVMAEPGYPIATGGTFRIEGVPPGDWTVELLYAIDDRMQQSQLGKVVGLREGEQRLVEFPLADLLPGEVRALVLKDGVPWPKAEIYCNGGWIRADARGQMVFRAKAGTYWPKAKIGDESESWLYSPQVVIRAGEQASTSLDFVRRKLRIRVLDADGVAVSQRSFYVSDYARTFETDGLGWLTLDPAPLQPCTLTYYEGWIDRASVLQLAKEDSTVWARMRRTTETFSMPAGQVTAEVEIRLPK